MKHFILGTCLLLTGHIFSQLSEDLIPKEAVTVFSVNNIKLLQKISIDDLVKYEFMEEVQQELFDGSTSNKTLKDAGLDFDQKLNVFYGKTEDYEISGFTFGIKDKEQLFVVFDDFEKLESPFDGVEFYGSFFNNLIIKDTSALLVRIEPTEERISDKTDSIWYSRGLEYPWINYVNDPGLEEDFIDEIPEESDMEYYDLSVDDVPIIEEIDPNQKNYFELRDSVQMEMQAELLKNLCSDLLVSDINLKTTDPRFAQQLTHESEGIFYLDNSRNIQKANGLWYFQTMFPNLYDDIREIYNENVLLGDLLLNENNIQFVMEAKYGEKLGSIYEKMNDSKFDKNVIKYIPNSNTAYFTYNVNMREAYEQAYKIIMPLLQDKRDPQISANVLTLELINEFVNKDALFGTYKGSMFGTFNGIKKVKTTKIVFDYDEETFEYSETEEEAEEDMPIFTIGFTTERGDIPLKVLKHLSRLTSRFKDMGAYWIYEDAILGAAPLYMISKNGLFIFTNDEDLALNHSSGYGTEAISKKDAKKSKKSGFMYAQIDWANAIDRFPQDFFNARQNEIIDAMRGKTGIMELTSSKTNINGTQFNLEYNYQGSFENSGKYLLDLLNSLYVITK
jgi:hypothetical protein